MDGTFKKCGVSSAHFSVKLVHAIWRPNRVRKCPKFTTFWKNLGNSSRVATKQMSLRCKRVLEEEAEFKRKALPFIAYFSSKNFVKFLFQILFLHCQYS